MKHQGRQASRVTTGDLALKAQASCRTVGIAFDHRTDGPRAAVLSRDLSERFEIQRLVLGGITLLEQIG